MITTVVVGLAIAVQLGDITLALLRDAAVGAYSRPTSVRAATGEQSGPLRFAALNSITGAHLFGRAPIEAAATSRLVSRAPLVLTGIIATGDPKDGFAILGASAASARVCHTGSQAAPGVELAEVYPQRVIVLRGGERLTLRLPQATIRDQLVSMRFTGTAAPPADEVGDIGDDGAPHPTPEDFKPPPLSTANTLARAFSLRPVSIGGARGVRIMGTGINSSTLTALGLEPGDVIMQINGVPIGTQDTPDLGKALNTGAATLVVDRNGDETSVIIDPAAAANAAAAYRNSAPD